MSSRIAYIADGKLFLLDGSEKPREIESEFARQLVAAALETHKRNEWKTRGGDTPFSGRMLWGVKDSDPSVVPVRFTGVSQCRDGSIAYLLQTDVIGGLFLYNPETRQEKRLFHREGFHAREMDGHPDGEWFAFTQGFPNGTANIVVMDEDGSSIHEVTEGDSIDISPSWLAGTESKLLYSGAGVGRNAKGHPAGLGPYAVMEIDLRAGTANTLLEDKAFDFLLPHKDRDGNLYVLRRPYEAGMRISPARMILDAVLFPFRLVRAIFHFLNFFSMMFSRKPLVSSANTSVEKEEQAMILLRGKYVDTRKTMRKAAAQADDAALVPADWELIRIGTDGLRKVLARNVVAFDLANDSSVFYTNGSAIYRLNIDGKRETIAKGKVVEELVVLE